jgi:uncharacterized protein
MKITEWKGDWGLVTGASSGIGREFCIQLARAGMNLVLVARRKDLLDALAAELREAFGVNTLVISADLTDPAAVAEIKARLSTAGIKVRLLCNNAAFGRWGRFEANEADIYSRMVALNVSAIVTMCRQFLEDLTSFRTSAIINVSSPAAFQPVPYMAVYAATKAFVSSLSQALFEEWKDRGVLVQTLIPGPTDTEFDKRAGAYTSGLKGRDPVQKAVASSLQHLEKGSPVATSAKGTYVQKLFAATFPARIVVREVAKMFRPPT